MSRPSMSIEAAVRREYPSLEVHFVRFDFDTRGATRNLILRSECDGRRINESVEQFP